MGSFLWSESKFTKIKLILNHTNEAVQTLNMSDRGFTILQSLVISKYTVCIGLRVMMLGLMHVTRRPTQERQQIGTSPLFPRTTVFMT